MARCHGPVATEGLQKPDPPGREPAAFLEVMLEPPHGGQKETKVRRGWLDRSGQELGVVLNPDKKGML